MLHRAEYKTEAAAGISSLALHPTQWSAYMARLSPQPGSGPTTKHRDVLLSPLHGTGYVLLFALYPRGRGDTEVILDSCLFLTPPSQSIARQGGSSSGYTWNHPASVFMPPLSPPRSHLDCY